MREKELRLALICYGGISLAVYMHGITKEVWRLAAASRRAQDGGSALTGSAGVYQRLLEEIARARGVRLRVFSDIVAGASAGGINGIFLARALTTGQSLDPLTDMWLTRADLDALIDPDARPLSRATKFWAAPLVWMAMKRRGNAIDRTVAREAQDEVRMKVSQLVRARWFAAPFGGQTFSHLLHDAFSAMAAGPVGPVLVPAAQPFDLFVTVTDFAGYNRPLALNSPAMVEEREHRLTLAFRKDGAAGSDLGDTPALAAAARATASFPGAFPPFTLAEADAVLRHRGMVWPTREAFIAAQLPACDEDPATRCYIDGSVLANAPFRPAIAALKQRPARREVDRRFVYIDPKPDHRAVSLGRPAPGSTDPPGWLSVILGALSEIPREQPIGDNVEALAGLSMRIRRMQHVSDGMRVEVEEQVEGLFGSSFFIDTPTPARLAKWRARAQEEAATRAGYAYAPYGHLKLSVVVEDLAALAARLAPAQDAAALRASLWAAVRARGIDRIGGKRGAGASAPVIDFFRQHDIGFRIRRLRFLARQLDTRVESRRAQPDPAAEALRTAIYAALALFLEREGDAWFAGLPAAESAAWLDAVAARRALAETDGEVDTLLAAPLAALPKDERRAMLFAYLGYPFYDIATLPLLQGEGLDEYDPIKIDRISPSDANAIRDGGAVEVLKGIEFNSFGAFFSRAYRENDYLWGRLHGADRLVDIVASTLGDEMALPEAELATFKRDAFRAILDEEEPRLTQVAKLVAELRSEIEGSDRQA